MTRAQGRFELVGLHESSTWPVHAGALFLPHEVVRVDFVMYAVYERRHFC